MKKSEKYDIKEASNPGLTASARRNYADNAESNAKGAKMYGKKHGPKMMGAKKGDQSKSRPDYAMESGKTDKGYKGTTGSSKGDQSATKKDYMGKAPKMYDKGPKMYDKGPKMESNAQEKKNLMNDNPIASRASGGSWMSKHTKSRM